MPRTAVPHPSAVADRRGHRSTSWVRPTNPQSSKRSSATGPHWAYRSNAAEEASAGGGAPTLPASAPSDRWCLTAMCSQAWIWPNCWTSTGNRADVTLQLVRVGDPRAFGYFHQRGGPRSIFLEGGSADRPDQCRLLCLPNATSWAGFRRAGGFGGTRCSRPCSPTAAARSTYVDASYWRDMGTPEDFVRGSADPGALASPRLRPCVAHRGEQLVHDGAAVSPGALRWPGVVGRGAEIGPGTRLDGAVIFDGVRWRPGA